MKQQNNKIRLVGKIVTPIEFSHESYGDRFLKFDIQILRLSGQADIIPIVLSEKIIFENIGIGDTVDVVGEFRSFSEYYDVGKCHLKLFAYAKEIKKCYCEYSLNEIRAKGYLCREPVYRETPFGRQIVDLLIAINREYNKSDYIPCIAWGRNALYLSNFHVGTEIELEGRVQSRLYFKTIETGQKIPKTAIELSMSKLKIIN